MYLSACSVRLRAAADDARPGEEPDRGLGRAEARGLVGDHEVADHRQLAAAAEGVAVDGGDRRLRELLDRAERAERLLDVGAAVADAAELAEALDVAADREALAGPVEDEDPDRRRRPGRVPRVSRSSVKKSRVIAFSFSGRSSVSHATGPRTS